MKVSTMFLNDITVIDHAYVDQDGNIKGGSYNLCLDITGDIDPVENVVIDFSTCKKQIKALVDDHKTLAVDHRLIYVKGFSGGSIQYAASRLSDNKEDLALHNGKWRVIATDHLEVTSSVHDWLTVLDFKEPLSDDVTFADCLGKYLETMLVDELRKLGQPVTDIKVNLSRKMIIPDAATTHIEFNYVHGLKSSTSYGCQNIAHGHASFIALEETKLNSDNKAEVYKLLNEMSEDMSGVLIWNDNLTAKDLVAYTSQRGTFWMNLKDTKHEFFNHETTVENLAAHVALVYGKRLKRLGVIKLWVSEGLSKGSLVVL